MKHEKRKLEELSLLLVMDSFNIPLSQYLNSKKLDFSINSMKEIDKYLEKICGTENDDQQNYL